MQLTGRAHRLGTGRCQRKPLGVFQGQPLFPRGRRPRKPLGAEPIYLHGQSDQGLQSAAGVQLASNFYVAAGSSTTYDAKLFFFFFASTDQNYEFIQTLLTFQPPKSGKGIESQWIYGVLVERKTKLQFSCSVFKTPSAVHGTKRNQGVFLS